MEMNKSKCPICSKPSEQQYRPFCSKHCANVDLGRWFQGRYAIPSTHPPFEEERFNEIEPTADEDIFK